MKIHFDNLQVSDSSSRVGGSRRRENNETFMSHALRSRKRGNYARVHLRETRIVVAHTRVEIEFFLAGPGRGTSSFFLPLGIVRRRRIR